MPAIVKAMRRILLAFVCAILALPLLFAALLAHGWMRDVPDPRFGERSSPFEVTSLRTLVPGPGNPEGTFIDRANNNLDIVRFAGRYFLGFRTAPHHWASDATQLHIWSSDDREQWRHEASVDLERRDLREPRFLALGDELFFYFFEAEDRAAGFAPLRINAMARRGDGSWTRPRAIFEPGHVVWRAKVRNGRAWMSVYQGREMYGEPGDARRTRLLTSEDGWTWRSVSGDESPIAQGGTGECAFEFDEAGDLTALVRVEARGSLVCRAPADRIERWDCRETAYRHDSPLLFRHGGRTFAIARRNLGGEIERGFGWLPPRVRFLWALLRYWVTHKRTTLYEVLPAELRTVPLVDLPSAGDTAFAGIVPLAPGRFWVANYTSPLSGIDPPWVVGQSRPTEIVSFELRTR